LSESCKVANVAVGTGQGSASTLDQGLLQVSSEEGQEEEHVEERQSGQMGRDGHAGFHPKVLRSWALNEAMTSKAFEWTQAVAK
jgi:hypothetical protein